MSLVGSDTRKSYTPTNGSMPFSGTYIYVSCDGTVNANMVEKYARKINSLISRFEDLFSTVGVLAMFVMAFGITINSLMRYFFNNPISGTVELVEVYLMAAIVYSLLPYLERRGENISVQLSLDRFGGPTWSAITVVTSVMSLLVFLFFTWLTYGITMDTTATQEVANTRFPVFGAWWIILLGFFLVSIRLIIKIITNLHSLYVVYLGGEV